MKTYFECPHFRVLDTKKVLKTSSKYNKKFGIGGFRYGLGLSFHIIVFRKAFIFATLADIPLKDFKIGVSI